MAQQFLVNLHVHPVCMQQRRARVAEWRLADAYIGTRVERELRNVLKRGGVIAGSSPGASILASYLVKGDPKGAEVMMGLPGSTDLLRQYVAKRINSATCRTGFCATQP